MNKSHDRQQDVMYIHYFVTLDNENYIKKFPFYHYLIGSNFTKTKFKKILILQKYKFIRKYKYKFFNKLINFNIKLQLIPRF